MNQRIYSWSTHINSELERVSGLWKLSPNPYGSSIRDYVVFDLNFILKHWGLDYENNFLNPYTSAKSIFNIFTCNFSWKIIDKAHDISLSINFGFISGLEHNPPFYVETILRSENTLSFNFTEGLPNFPIVCCAKDVIKYFTDFESNPFKFESHWASCHHKSRDSTNNNLFNCKYFKPEGLIESIFYPRHKYHPPNCFRYPNSSFFKEIINE